jgi:integrase/recombinase XerD
LSAAQGYGIIYISPTLCWVDATRRAALAGGFSFYWIFMIPALDKTIDFKRAFALARTINDITPQFFEFLKYERRFDKKTLKDYERIFSLVIIPNLGKKNIRALTPQDCHNAVYPLVQKGLGVNYHQKIIFVMRSLFKFINVRFQIRSFDYRDIEVPRLPRKEVTFLTKRELNKIFECLPGKDIYELRMRALLEVLFGTGMRINEALALNKDDIDWHEKEAIVLGKGKKERVIFFTDRSLFWLKRYFDARKDNHPAVFSTHCTSKRWGHKCVRALLSKYQKEWGINKRIHPHLIRHTTATQLLFNGADLRSVQTIMGHASERTTLHYYAGVDKRRAKKVHKKCLEI